jgi:hypothetical protein
VKREINNVRIISFLQKKSLEFNRGFLINLAVPNLPASCPASTIGVAVLTSVFGMGTGVALQLYPPEICLTLSAYIVFLELFPKTST